MVVVDQGRKSIAPPSNDDKRMSLYVPSQDLVPSTGTAMRSSEQ